MRSGRCAPKIGQLRTDMTHDIGALRTEVTHEIGLLRSESRSELGQEVSHLRTDMAATETRLTAAITKVGNDVEILRRDMTIRLGAIAIASTGVVLGAMRYMLMHP